MELKAENLRAGYGHIVAVDGVSFSAAPGSVTGLLGPNGAGKSTTLRILAGAMLPASGTVSAGGISCADNPRAYRASLGYLPENNPLHGEFTVAEHLLLSAEFKGLTGAAAENAARESVASCGLEEVLSRKTAELSKGFRQRTGLAIALLGNPPILLLDEPTSGLDPNQAAETRALIRRLREGRVIMLSTHILSEAQACCDRLLIMSAGRLAASGTQEELLREAGAGLTVITAASMPATELAAKLAPFGTATPLPYEGETAVRLVQNDTRDLRGEIFALAAKEGWPLLELRSERQPLEEFFRRLTQ